MTTNEVRDGAWTCYCPVQTLAAGRTFGTVKLERLQMTSGTFSGFLPPEGSKH